jgi:hypothetical protein
MVSIRTRGRRELSVSKVQREMYRERGTERERRELRQRERQRSLGTERDRRELSVSIPKMPSLGILRLV